jgi:hypothetical protein
MRALAVLDEIKATCEAGAGLDLAVLVEPIGSSCK